MRNYFPALGHGMDGLHRLMKTGRWAIGLVWSTSPGLVVGLVVVTLLLGLAPAGLALAMREIVNEVVSAAFEPGETFARVLPWLALGLVITLTEVLGRHAEYYVKDRLLDDLDLSVTSRFLAHAATLDVSFFESLKHQDLIERARQANGGLVAVFISDIMSLSLLMVQVLSLSIVLMTVEPLGLALLFPLALAYFLFQWKVSKSYYFVDHDRADKKRWIRYFIELLTDRNSVAEVKLLGLAQPLQNRFRTLMTKFRDENKGRYILRISGAWLSGLIGTIAVYGLFARVVYKVVEGVLTVGDIAVFGTAAIRLRTALEGCVMHATGALERTLYISNLQEFLQLHARIPETGGRVPTVTKGTIEFKNVSFAYPGAKQAALHEVSFRVEEGETLALVGRNGAGKTTLIKLLTRFYDPDTGSIELDGVDLRELSLEYLHRNSAVVFQNFRRFEATAFENIAYGDWERLLNDPEEVMRIAKQVGVSDLFESFPQGFDTVLGRRFGAHDLSGGQWQQIAIARALARDAPLVILDEPTSNLDAESEYQIFDRFRQLARGRTTILVSHRFSTVAMADRIAVFDGGRMNDIGTHTELMARGGLYSTFYELHTRQMESASAGDRIDRELVDQ